MSTNLCQMAPGSLIASLFLSFLNLEKERPVRIAALNVYIFLSNSDHKNKIKKTQKNSL